MMWNHIGGRDIGLDGVPAGLQKLALMIDVQKLFTLGGIQIKTISPDKFQGVPLRRIVSRSDCDSPVGPQKVERELHARSRADSQVNYLASSRQQARTYC